MSKESPRTPALPRPREEARHTSTLSIVTLSSRGAEGLSRPQMLGTPSPQSAVGPDETLPVGSTTSANGGESQGNEWDVGHLNSRSCSSKYVPEDDLPLADEVFSHLPQAAEPATALGVFGGLGDDAGGQEHPPAPSSPPRSPARAHGQGASAPKARPAGVPSPAAAKDSAGFSPRTAQNVVSHNYSPRARECLAVGCFDEAGRFSQLESDYTTWAAALVLSGDAAKAVEVIEAFVVSACIVLYEQQYCLVQDGPRRHLELMSELARSSCTTSLVPREFLSPGHSGYQRAVLELCDVLPWSEIHQWYLLAVILHPNYSPPSSPWMRYYLAMGDDGSGESIDPQEPFAAIEVESLLISQCSKKEIVEVTALSSWVLGRHRTALEAASIALTCDANNTLLRFVRCVSAAHLCERVLVMEDTVAMMQSESQLVVAVGCSLALYGIPLPSAREAVLSYAGTLIERHYVYALSEWMHALTLLQLGEVHAAHTVAVRAIGNVPLRGVISWLSNILVHCCIALEDSVTIFKLPPTPEQLLLVALSPGFYGGFRNGSVERIRVKSTVGRLLLPRQIRRYESVRQLLPGHVVRARAAVDKGDLVVAWREACAAVACADDIVGSVEFAFTDCAPHHVYFFAIVTGIHLLETLTAESWTLASTMAGPGARSQVEAEKNGLLKRIGSLRSIVSASRKRSQATEHREEQPRNQSFHRPAPIDSHGGPEPRDGPTCDEPNPLLRPSHHDNDTVGDKEIIGTAMKRWASTMSSGVLQRTSSVRSIKRTSKRSCRENDSLVDALGNSAVHLTGSECGRATAAMTGGEDVDSSIHSRWSVDSAADPESWLEDSDVVSAVHASGEAPTPSLLLKTMDEYDALGEEVITSCERWVEHLRTFFPGIRLGHIARAQLGIALRERDFMGRAIMLASTFPRSVLAQTTLMSALYANHHIPESINYSKRVLQLFPHSREARKVYLAVNGKEGSYTYNYRNILCLEYAPSEHKLLTKRMYVVFFLLLVNVALLLVTLIVNTVSPLVLTESGRWIALRLQCPSLIPFYFAGLFIVYALLVMMSPNNLVGVIMNDLYFIESPLNRFLFAIRGVVLVNLVNALQITFAANKFLLEGIWPLILLYATQLLLFMPFTTRIWFLRSIDEPRIDIIDWLTLLMIDAVTAVVVVLPHIVLAAIEPFMFGIFFFFIPTRRPTENSKPGIPSSVRKRLMLHARYRDKMTPRFTSGSGSTFIHIRLLHMLFYCSHPNVSETKYLAEAQEEEEGYLVFPMVHLFGAPIDPSPLEWEDVVKPPGARTGSGGEGSRSIIRPRKTKSQQGCSGQPSRTQADGTQLSDSGQRAIGSDDIDELMPLRMSDAFGPQEVKADGHGKRRERQRSHEGISLRESLGAFLLLRGSGKRNFMARRNAQKIVIGGCSDEDEDGDEWLGETAVGHGNQGGVMDMAPRWRADLEPSNVNAAVRALRQGFRERCRSQSDQLHLPTLSDSRSSAPESLSSVEEYFGSSRLHCREHPREPKKPLAADASVASHPVVGVVATERPELRDTLGKSVHSDAPGSKERLGASECTLAQSPSAAAAPSTRGSGAVSAASEATEEGDVPERAGATPFITAENPAEAFDGKGDASTRGLGTCVPGKLPLTSESTVRPTGEKPQQLPMCYTPTPLPEMKNPPFPTCNSAPNLSLHSPLSSPGTRLLAAPLALRRTVSLGSSSSSRISTSLSTAHAPPSNPSGPAGVPPRRWMSDDSELPDVEMPSQARTAGTRRATQPRNDGSGTTAHPSAELSFGDATDWY